jgi:hypothetical protein
MRERVWREHAEKRNDAALGPAGVSRLQEVRQDGRRLVEVGNRVIERALSRDSEYWLRSSCQEGGE